MLIQYRGSKVHPPPPIWSAPPSREDVVFPGHVFTDSSRSGVGDHILSYDHGRQLAQNDGAIGRLKGGLESTMQPSFSIYLPFEL